MSTVEQALEQGAPTRPLPRIRLASAADAAVLTQLRYELRTGLAPDVTPEAGFHERCMEWMAARLHWTDVWRCWLAEDEVGEALGVVWLQFLEKLPNPVGEPGLHGYLTGFYVREAARNRGVGTALLTAALAACEERGIDTVFLWPSARSRALYERHGFAEQSGVLTKAVSGKR
ncbi:MAG TPA: GNAT family N-acetyltransferase [Gemmatimonadales bacterium]|nr:GNAT family N-acetyltransferase [Gemmatimonadales bacterium]